MRHPSRYWANSEYAPTPDKTNLTRGPWNYTFTDFGFEATTEDAVSHMQTWVSAADYSFNISWDATSTALHNLGSGTFNFGGANNSQWSLPACRTQGTLTIGDTEFTIDPENSHTWYDRQWGYSKPPTFTWLGLRFPESDISLSVWAIDYASGTSDHEWRFATVRTSLADQILSLNFIPDANSTWTSPSSNNTYPTRWTLEFQNGDSIVVTSARPDQELGTGISAFVHVEGSFLGNQGGSGVVDVLL
ncbi:hypothetical protein SLS56_008949 [Neofusicoccum ribis]|uniref:AttH domain-containing protein n=1 Tax=Neofusicoccum ribis TaxID=45134 RepID=A0ABR3SIR1_9PEZI